MSVGADPRVLKIICNSRLSKQIGDNTDKKFLNIGAVIGSKSFDTYGNASAGVGLRDYLNAANGE